MEFSTNLITQTLPVGFSLVIGSPPIFYLSASRLVRSILFGSASLALLFVLYRTVIWISEHTYSVSLRGIRSNLLSVCAYFFLGAAVISVGYVLFVRPHSHPKFSIADAFLGVVYSLLYAELAAFGVMAAVRSETKNRQVSENIENFLELTDRVQQGPDTVDESEIEDIIQLANKIASEIEDEPVTGTNQTAERLRAWADTFEAANDFIGREQCVNSSEFSELTNDLSTLS
ncbi:hypothetical protein [Halorubrum ezzemoulense]|uniref:hypothetical protein n=1 Tax=Halorubrum ezzemoulense TaxID=337243 RepID=UPI00232CA300|nr:hypothetical protein [Halorubrum ezzemoulense]MDB2239241.1 hypothetical protein [Halorubrum ezzemoulense]